MKIPTDNQEDQQQPGGLRLEANIVPMIDSNEEEVFLDASDVPPMLPVMPLMDQVLFPGVVMPIAVRRTKARRLIKEAHRLGGMVAVFPQKNNVDDPEPADLYELGVVARVLKTFPYGNDTTVAVMQGVVRCGHLNVLDNDPFMIGEVEQMPEQTGQMDTPLFRRRLKKARKMFSDLVSSHRRDDNIGPLISGIGANRIFINFAASHLEADIESKYALLSADSYTGRLDLLLELLADLEYEAGMQDEIDDKTRNVIESQQREYFLRHQLDIIQEELGGKKDDGAWAESDAEGLKKRAAKKDWPAEAAAAFERELEKLKRIHPMSPDYSVQLSYLETLVDLPWNHCVAETYSMEKARRVLDRDHYGIEKVKERVIEYLAVRLRQAEKGLAPKAQVLCLVGAPGTGKTSICRSVAAAIGRPYRRVALGGLHDEAEIRGHRRTYIGAMPGRIIQELAKAGASNPVFVLDEIDKVQANAFNGDPSSALLEVLDPEQNCRFHDNFINLDYDLSKVFFIATANSVADIQPALLDRMEVIDFSGYMLEEKLEIAKHHLLPRVLKDNVLTSRQLKMDDGLLKHIINDYTREGGVRQLEKQLQKLVRHRVVRLARGEECRATLTVGEADATLGLPIHNSERARKEPREGVVTGLAWTPVGGEILFIEASVSKGKGTLSMTGNLGDVMKESATLAFEYIKSNCERFGIAQERIDESNIHIHVPEGATPKDGPSAGITMFVAMVSAFTHAKVCPEVAMTGEITLRGEVTPVGGIKEKILAAKRAGISRIILCHDNRRDVEDIGARYLEGLQFHYIGEMCEALPLALAPQQ